MLRKLLFVTTGSTSFTVCTTSPSWPRPEATSSGTPTSKMRTKKRNSPRGEGGQTTAGGTITGGPSLSKYKKAPY